VTVGVDGGSLQVQVGWLGLEGWQPFGSVCIHRLNRVNSRNGLAAMTGSFNCIFRIDSIALHCIFLAFRLQLLNKLELS